MVGAVEMAKQKRVLVLVTAVSLAGWAFAQQQTPATPAPQPQTQASAAPPPRPVYEPAAVLKVKTRLVLVDIVATDNKGKPVVDLKAEDFTLEEYGREQKIRVFSFQHPTGATESQPDTANAATEYFYQCPSL